MSELGGRRLSPLSSSKKRSLTPSKARERLNELEESTTARQARIEQVEERLSRLDTPDPKLSGFLDKLLRRQKAELTQLEKLQNLLASRAKKRAIDSSEPAALPSEELDALHRSFEELRAGLRQVREADLDDLGRQVARIQVEFEEFRNEVEDERRKLQRSHGDLVENQEALSETLEESVVGTVDVSGRCDDIEERLDGLAELLEQTRNDAETERSQIMAKLDELQNKLSLGTSAPAPISEPASAPLNDDRIEKLESALAEVLLELGQQEDIFDYEVRSKYGPPAVFEPELE